MRRVKKVFDRAIHHLGKRWRPRGKVEEVHGVGRSPSCYATLTAGITGGASPYTVNFFNLTSGSPVLAQVVYGAPSNTFFTLLTNSLTNGAQFSYNVIVTDSGSPANVFNSISTGITVNTMLSTSPTLTQSNTLLDSGQWITYNVAGVSGGTPPYQAGLYNLTGLPANEPMAAQFSGASNVVKVPYSSSLSLTSQATMSGWYYVHSVSPTLMGTVVAQQGASTFSSFGSARLPAVIIRLRYSSLQPGNGYGGWTPGAQPALAANQWYFIVATYSSATSTLSLYINGAQYTTTSVATGQLVASTNPVYIGDYSGYYTNGQIADVQIYNTALSQSQVSALYANGLSASPIVPANIVGWWLLNGNANDLSGLGNNGIATSVSYAIRPSYVVPIYPERGKQHGKLPHEQPNKQQQLQLQCSSHGQRKHPSAANSIANSFTANIAPSLSITQYQIQYWTAGSTQHSQ